MNSWLTLSRWRVWPAMALAMDTASTSPSNAMARAPGTSRPQFASTACQGT